MRTRSRMPLPPQTRLGKWILQAKSIVRSFFDPLVVVTVMTAASLIAAILEVTGLAVSKKVFALCVAIAVIGLVAVVYQMLRLYRIDMAKALLNDLLAEGTDITQTVDDKVIQGEQAIREWCAKVEVVLRKYLGESYVKRFHQGGSNTQGPDRMTVWKNNHRLETLATFLTELR